jgi:hypothetical protein
MEKKEREEANKGEEIHDNNDNEHIVFAIHESEPSRMTFDASEEGQIFNFDNPDVINPNEYDTPLIFYNWLADSATTSYVCNQHEVFTKFHLLSATTVTGVGNLVTKTKG